MINCLDIFPICQWGSCYQLLTALNKQSSRQIMCWSSKYIIGETLWYKQPCRITNIASGRGRLWTNQSQWVNINSNLTDVYFETRLHCYADNKNGILDETQNKLLSKFQWHVLSLQREIWFLRWLSHPNIVSIEEVFSSGSYLYVFSEFYDFCKFSFSSFIERAGISHFFQCLHK